MTPIKIPREHKIELLRRIQHYFETERSETIGDLAAENLLDFVLKQIGPYVYNQALRDAKTVVLRQWNVVEEELYAMEIPVDLSRRS